MTRLKLAGSLLAILIISNSSAAQSPGSALGFLKLGNAALAAGDWKSAIRDYTSAIQVNSRHPLNEKPTESSVSANAEPCGEIAMSDDFNAFAFNNRGIAHYRLGNSEKAIADFNRAIRINPRLADAYNNRGNVWQAKGDLAKALLDFDQAIKLNPRHSLAFNNRANIRQTKGDSGAAINDYNRSIELDSSNASAFANRGLTLLQLGRDPEATADFNRALKLDPSLKNRLEALIRLERKPD